MTQRRQTIEPEHFFRAYAKLGAKDVQFQTWNTQRSATTEILDWLSQLDAADHAAGIQAEVVDLTSDERWPVAIPALRQRPTLMDATPEVLL